MITVQILINGQVILARSARNVGSAGESNDEGYPTDMCLYHVDDGSTIKHKRSDGAVKLAHLLLDTIKEP